MDDLKKMQKRYMNALHAFVEDRRENGGIASPVIKKEYDEAWLAWFGRAGIIPTEISEDGDEFAPDPSDAAYNAGYSDGGAAAVRQIIRTVERLMSRTPNSSDKQQEGAEAAQREIVRLLKKELGTESANEVLSLDEIHGVMKMIGIEGDRFCTTTTIEFKKCSLRICRDCDRRTCTGQEIAAFAANKDSMYEQVGAWFFGQDELP